MISYVLVHDNTRVVRAPHVFKTLLLRIKRFYRAIILLSCAYTPPPPKRYTTFIAVHQTVSQLLNRYLHNIFGINDGNFYVNTINYLRLIIRIHVYILRGWLNLH